MPNNINSYGLIFFCPAIWQMGCSTAVLRHVIGTVENTKKNHGNEENNTQEKKCAHCVRVFAIWRGWGCDLFKEMK